MTYRYTMMLAEAAYFFHSTNDARSFLIHYDPNGDLPHIMYDNIEEIHFYLWTIDTTTKKDDINWMKEGF